MKAAATSIANTPRRQPRAAAPALDQRVHAPALAGRDQVQAQAAQARPTGDHDRAEFERGMPGDEAPERLAMPGRLQVAGHAADEHPVEGQRQRRAHTC